MERQNSNLDILPCPGWPSWFERLSLNVSMPSPVTHAHAEDYTVVVEQRQLCLPAPCCGTERWAYFWLTKKEFRPFLLFLGFQARQVETGRILCCGYREASWRQPDPNKTFGPVRPCSLYHWDSLYWLNKGQTICSSPRDFDGNVLDIYREK